MHAWKRNGRLGNREGGGGGGDMWVKGSCVVRGD